MKASSFVLFCANFIFFVHCIHLDSLYQRPKFNVVDFGAIGDGKTINTEAIQTAIQAASEAGGGNVFVPSGIFVTGAFNLTSHVYLELATSAVLYATDDPSEYVCLPSVTTDTGPCDYPLVNIVDSVDVAILGPGAINGGANDPEGHLVDHYDEQNDFLVPKSMALPGCDLSSYSCRPKLLVIKHSKSIVLYGAQLLNSPLWTVTVVESSDILVDGMEIAGDRRWPNNDGFDPVDSSNIIIQNTHMSTGDDCICVITHTAVSISNITVQKSRFASSSAALKISAFESTASGDITNITFQNNEIYDSNRGLSIMPRWGTGRISNVLFKDITIQTRFFTSPWWGSAEPIYVTSLSESETQEWNGTVDTIVFENIKATSEAGVVVFGNTSMISNLVFSDVTIVIAKWYSNTTNPVHDWRPSPPPSMVYAPIDGFYLDGVNGLVLQDCRVQYMGDSDPSWGICLNTTNISEMTQHNFHCGMANKQ